MKKKQQSIQLILVATGIILFTLTYLYYPSIKLNKDKISRNELTVKDPKKTLSDEESTTFEQLEYNGLYDFDKPFKVKSEKAYILNEEPDMVYMSNMHVILYLADNRVVEITSSAGRYNKVNYDCFFEKNVLATDGETIITAKNLDLLATENFVEIYNDVSLDYSMGTLKADKIDYNFETKHFIVSMFNDQAIKMKVTR